MSATADPVRRRGVKRADGHQLEVGQLLEPSAEFVVAGDDDRLASAEFVVAGDDDRLERDQ